MPRRPLAHVDAELSGRMTSLDITRAQLFDVDVDRKKRIDAAIDYFGGGHTGVAREVRSESSRDETGVRC